MAIPLVFSTTLAGTTLTLTIKADPAYPDPVSNFDITLGYSTSLATFTSNGSGAGYLVQGNGSTAGSVALAGIAADTVGASGGPTLATVTFNLLQTTADFPLTLSNTALNNDNPASGSADPTVPCFVAGTRLRTASGEVAVEALQVDDLVMTLDGALSRVRWVGQRRIACGAHPAPQDVMPVRVRAGAAGEGVPCRDLLLSPDHAVHFEGSLIPVRYLLNGTSIVQEDWTEVTYVHVELQRHAVVLAEGMPAESYLDTGNRHSFGADVTNVVVLPAAALGVWASKACAPLVHGGPVLERARAHFLARAGLLGHSATGDADLHLVVDGRVVRGEAAGNEVRFAVPAGARAVRLASRRFVPAHVVPSSIDCRVLGVAVARLVVDGVVQSPEAGDGWHGAEAGLHWTDGDAAVALGRSVAVTIVPLGQYWVEEAGVRAA